MSALATVGAVLVLAALVAPHFVSLRRAPPPAAIAVWLLALALRALAASILAVLALIGLADVPLVRAALDWCWHALLPNLSGSLGFGEHPLSHAAVALPAAAVCASVAWLAARGLGALRAKRRLLSLALGRGPLGSTVIHHDGVLLAVTGLGRGRVVVSDRALGELDDGELAAGLVHELAHLRRCHRPLLAAGALLAAIGRALPLTRHAEAELRFHVERDADQYTVRELEDPLALASAICKAAGVVPAAAVTGLGGGRVSARLEELLERPPASRRSAERRAWMLAAALASVFAVIAASAPGFAAAGASESLAGTHACDHAR